jgi:hypothetical protein
LRFDKKGEPCARLFVAGQITRCATYFVVAEPDEVLVYLDQHSLHGKGIGYVDVHLLASTAISGAKLWTRDKRLRLVARELGCALAEAGER